MVAKRTKMKIKIFPRYRKPSLKTILGITAAKKRVKKQLGITALMKPFRARKNFERRVKRKVGYYSEPMKFFRFLFRHRK